MSNLSRLSLMILTLATAAAHAAEQPAPGTRTRGTLSQEATAAGPAVNTSAAQAPDTPSTTSSQAPASQEPTTSRRATATSSQAAPRAATDRLKLDTTVVTGNRELPKVLYIVPWKKSDLGELPAQPFNTLLDEALAPLDRDVFRREVTYYGAVSGGPDAAPAQAESSEK